MHLSIHPMILSMINIGNLFLLTIGFLWKKNAKKGMFCGHEGSASDGIRNMGGECFTCEDRLHGIS